jgi:hypothetical protein
MMKFPKLIHGILTLGLFCLLSGSMTKLHAQYGPGDSGQELRFNMGLFLATGTVEAAYEYYISRDMSIGLTGYFDNDKTDFNGGFGIGGLGRAYFGQRRNGPFVEVFGLYYTGEDEEIPTVDQKYTSFALGGSGGVKYVNPSGRFVIEGFGGVGRNLNPKRNQDTFMFRVGLSLGYRF